MWSKDRRDRQYEERDLYRQARRILKEDLAVLGDELDALRSDVDTFPATARGHFHRAVADHDQVASALAAAEDMESVRSVEPRLVDARWHLAALRAVRAGQDLPPQGSECFFNPQHGPAAQTVDWAPLGEETQPVQACRACAQRLAEGGSPDHRLVRVGDRHVPWWQGVAPEDRKSGPKGAVAVNSDYLMSATEAEVGRHANSVATATWLG